MIFRKLTAAQEIAADGGQLHGWSRNSSCFHSLLWRNKNFLMQIAYQMLLDLFKRG